jgi:tRNA-2-methylthio-N6-dimethylallyladenosine synthase
MAETDNVMPSLHMPLQSGSDPILKKMRRAYRRDRFLSILDSVRARIPEAAITTDIIVGFPSETEEDFLQTLDLVRQARFSAAFTFQYSIRPGTEAALMDDQVPHEVVKQRYSRLVELVDEIAWEENKALVGTEVEVMFASGEGRKDEKTMRVSGRAKDNRLVHVALSGEHQPRPGDIATAIITYAAPHHLLADHGFTDLVPTPGGDAWQSQTGDLVNLGLPKRR